MEYAKDPEILNGVLSRDIGDNGLITLNRPKQFNALHFNMLGKLHEILKEWETCKKLVVIEGAGDKAFCSGGDLKMLLEHTFLPNGLEFVKLYHGPLYAIIYLISNYKIPYVALMNNVTIGSATALSVYGKYRIITEKSLYAMPEVNAGYCPDAGCFYIFPRLQGQLGMFMGLTGHALKGADIIHAGIGTHYVPAERLEALKNDLLESHQISYAQIDKILGKYQENIAHHKFSLMPYMGKINECFSASSVEEIIEKLEADGSDWARRTLKTLLKASPMSLKLTHYCFNKGKSLGLAECLNMEYRIACTFIRMPNSQRGFTALYQKKDEVEWVPSNLKDVSMEHIIQLCDTPNPELELGI